MNRHQIHQVAHLASSGGRHYFVGCKVDGVQDIAESGIPHGGKEAEIAVDNPFEARLVVVPRDLGSINQWQLP